MNNKKIAAIVLIFVILFLVLVLGIGFFGAIPLIGKWIAFVLACLLVVFCVVFFWLAWKSCGDSLNVVANYQAIRFLAWFITDTMLHR